MSNLMLNHCIFQWLLYNIHMLIFSSVDIFLQVWLVGDGLTEKEQSKAAKGTLFIPFSIFPPKKVRKDCYYHTTPAMEAPKSLENLHSCEVSSCLFDKIFLSNGN